MKKIFDLFRRFKDIQRCPECKSEKVSLGVDSLIGVWFPFCEDCGFRGMDRDLIIVDENVLTS